MGIAGHIVTSAAVFGTTLALTGSFGFAIGASLGSLLWDIDHLLDYWILDHQHNLNPLLFIRHFTETDRFPARRLLLLHSHEVILALIVLASVSRRQLPLALAIGGFIHIVSDIAPDGFSHVGNSVKRYALLYRLRCSFRSDRIYR